MLCTGTSKRINAGRDNIAAENGDDDGHRGGNGAADGDDDDVGADGVVCGDGRCMAMHGFHGEQHVWMDRDL